MHHLCSAVQSKFYLQYHMLLKGLLLTLFLYVSFIVCICADACCHFCPINEYDDYGIFRACESVA